MKNPLVKERNLASILGLAFERDRLSLVWLKRTNGSAENVRELTIPLSVDPFASEPELVGHEIRKHLAEAKIRERKCAVSLPLSWVLTATVALPDLPEPDLANLIELEVERSFPFPPDALVAANSRYHSPRGDQFATILAVPRDQISRLQQILAAAQLEPSSFSLALNALCSPATHDAHASMSVFPLAHELQLQVNCGEGIAILRALPPPSSPDPAEREAMFDELAREIRITLGQLPDAFFDDVRVFRVLGNSDLSGEIAQSLRPFLESRGIETDRVRELATVSGLKLPAASAPWEPLAVAAQLLSGRKPALEFLPPRVSRWQAIADRYSSRKLVSSGILAGAIAVIVIAVFLGQYWKLSRLENRWNAIKPQADELAGLQDQIKQYRPWFDESFRNLSILRRLSLAFPEEGTIWLKTLEISDPGIVNCTGIAHDNQALLRTLDELRASSEINDLKVNQMQGSPVQFSFGFRWGHTGPHED